MLHKELTPELDVEDGLAVGIAYICCCEFMWAVHALGGCSTQGQQEIASQEWNKLDSTFGTDMPSNLLTGDADCMCHRIEVSLWLRSKGTGYDGHGRHSRCSGQDRYSRRGTHGGRGGVG